MRQGFWLRFGLRWGGESGLGFGGGGCAREQVDFFGDGTAEVVEGLADVGGVVIGFVGVLGAVVMRVRGDSVVSGGERKRTLLRAFYCGLALGRRRASPARDSREVAGSERGIQGQCGKVVQMGAVLALSSALPNCSFSICCVRPNVGPIEALQTFHVSVCLTREAMRHNHADASSC